jgi:biopolymer transport protein ExbD
MKFIHHKRRTAPAVIIVALIDVLIVLLIFLICTTTFRQQPALRLALPESSSAMKSGVNENPPLIIKIGKDGVLRYGRGSAEGDVVTPDQLRGRLVLESEKLRSAGKEVRLAIGADKDAPWGRVVQVMDMAKAANIRISSAYMKEAVK